jgi:hypothetical protein
VQKNRYATSASVAELAGTFGVVKLTPNLVILQPLFTSEAFQSTLLHTKHVQMRDNLNSFFFAKHTPYSICNRVKN